MAATCGTRTATSPCRIGRKSAPICATRLRKQQIDLVRQGLWKVVNESGGTGSAGRVKNVAVAGKTGTAQWADRGN